MSVYLNPFYARAAEHYRDSHQFVTTFGAGALDMLPTSVWDRLVIFRSSPGAGKTSIMRLFTVENLEWARLRLKVSDPVRSELETIGAIDDAGPRKLGVFVDLDRDYRSLLDLPIGTADVNRLFLRLLDVRIMTGVMRASLAISGSPFPSDTDRLSFAIPSGDARTELLLERIGGPTGVGILDYARRTERTLLRLLDALLDADVEDLPDGHNELYSLTVLADCEILVDGEAIRAQPLLMFDDGHRLEGSQRALLLSELRLRRTSIARWYAERFEALSDQELLADVGEEGRDVTLIDIDKIARQGSADGRRFSRGRHDKVLADIARRRAAPQLAIYAQEHQEFLDLLDDDRESILKPESEVVSTLRGRTMTLAAEDERYRTWIDDANSLTGYQAALRWRELEVLLLRDQERQADLFGDPLTLAESASRSNASLREACALAISGEFKLPYFGGTPMILSLGSHNAHQFLTLCGDLFAEMLVDVSLGRPPRLGIARQNRVLRHASERYWESIPRTVPQGRDVQGLVREIVAIGRIENAKPRMPYPPGVTGTALLMSERKLLLDPEYRSKTPGAERLFRALASAVAHNVITADLDYSVKNNRYMVLYLNRLLCPTFGLPLGFGGFKERRLTAMLDWMRKLPTTGARPRSVEASGRLEI